MTISAEEFKAQFLFEFSDFPADVRLHNVEPFRRLAEVQFACHGQGEFHFLKWGSNTHIFHRVSVDGLHQLRFPFNCASTFIRLFRMPFGASE
jgi:hypothetical protein